MMVGARRGCRTCSRSAVKVIAMRRGDGEAIRGGRMVIEDQWHLLQPLLLAGGTGSVPGIGSCEAVAEWMRPVEFEMR
jgi:hypothetical protein